MCFSLWKTRTINSYFNIHMYKFYFVPEVAGLLATVSPHNQPKKEWYFRLYFRKEIHWKLSVINYASGCKVRRYKRAAATSRNIWFQTQKTWDWTAITWLRQPLEYLYWFRIRLQIYGDVWFVFPKSLMSIAHNLTFVADVLPENAGLVDSRWGIFWL